MKPVDVATSIVETLPDALCIASLGTAVSALRVASNDGPHYYFGASMGSALATAMGVAEAVPQRTVVALLGDGELLMGASVLWSVGAYQPQNLIAVVLADGRYSITGGQSLSRTTNFAAVAEAIGGIEGRRAKTANELAVLLREPGRPRLIEAEVDEPAWPGPSPFVDPARVRVAFEDNIAGVGTGHVRALTSGQS
ncbi:MAG TPA: thiamine pyrophosphate-dependent enzyme [Jatrophihabitans sp.]|nr:thiamine pyrophosphate-dependent enzyme [Jatrophihabitans sp.]